MKKAKVCGCIGPWPGKQSLTVERNVNYNQTAPLISRNEGEEDEVVILKVNLPKPSNASPAPETQSEITAPPPLEPYIPPAPPAEPVEESICKYHIASVIHHGTLRYASCIYMYLLYSPCT
jgi:hypothetical protein